MRVFITGAAGFIGFHLAQLLKRRVRADVVIQGIDNFNTYYDVRLKRARAARLVQQGIPIIELDICHKEAFEQVVNKFAPTHIVHLAAQAGVRYSLEHPEMYMRVNGEGFVHLLEIACKLPRVRLIYASSSSVYGLNDKLPYAEEDAVEQQASLYGVTKRTNELLAATYHHLYGLRSIGLRYFTVYGPWGRPDMAIFRFAEAIEQGLPIDLYNYGKMQRDFTYVDDIVEGTAAALDYQGDFSLFNLGNHAPEPIERLVAFLEKGLGKVAERRLLPLQLGDVLATYADISRSQKELGFYPKTGLEEGVAAFVQWYKEWRHAKGGT